MGRTKGLIIDPSDICYEEECEEIGFEAPGEIKGNLVEGFSFTNEPVQFAHTGLMSIFWTQKVKLFYAALLANNSH